MKKYIYALVCFVLLFLFGNNDVNALEIQASDVPNNAYIIGTHMFTEKTVLSTKHIMLGATTIDSDKLSDMVIYYKTPRGKWIDGLTGESIVIPDIINIEYEDTNKLTKTSNILSNNSIYAYRTNENRGSPIIDNLSNVFAVGGFNYVSSLGIQASDISNNTYIIGTHMFTDQIVLTTRHIMLGATTIDSDKLSDMVIYYKTPRGKWIDGLTGDNITISNEINIEYKDTKRLVETPILVDYDFIYDDQTNEGKYNFKINNINGISGLEVYYSSIVDGEYKLLSTFESTDILDNSIKVSVGAENNNYYKVRAYRDYNFGKVYSDYSNVYHIEKYNIDYNLNGGKFIYEALKYSGNYYVSSSEFNISNPIRDGYIFAGWTGSNGTTPEIDLTIDKGTTGNLSYTANWISNNDTVYKVIHQQMELDGTTYTTVNTEKKTGASGSKVIPPVKNYEGFTSPETQEVTIAADGSTSVIYKYVRNKYTFTLENKTGVTTTGSSANGSYYYGATITLKAVANTGYTWNKWNSSDNSFSTTTANTTFVMPAGNLIMTPSVTENTYTIVYNGNSATDGNTASSTHTYNVAKELTANGFSKKGYTFMGWSNTPTGSKSYDDKQSVLNLTSTADEIINLYAVWRPNTLSVYYNANGGSLASSTLFTFDSENYVLNADGERACTKIKYGEPMSGSGFLNYNNPNTLNLVPPSGMAKAPNGKEWKCTSPGCKKTYYGQDVSYNVNTEVCDISLGDCTIDLYVNWSYEVRYDANGGTGAPVSQYKIPGEMITLSNVVPTRYGYMFKGWSMDGTADSTIYAKGDVYTADEGIVLKAIWEEAVWEDVPDKIHFVDSLNDNYTGGSNDMTILESNGKFAIIDFGYIDNNEDKVYNYLDKIGVKEFEFAILTHAHNDHIGFLNDFSTKYPIKQIYLKDSAKNYLNALYGGEYKKVFDIIDANGIPIKNVEETENQEIVFGNMNLSLYNTDFILNATDTSRADNANSVVTLINVNGKKICVAGDIGEYASERAGLSTEEKNQLNTEKATFQKIGIVDVYKVAHHGYTTYQNSLAALQLLKPTYSVINNEKSYSGVKDIVPRLQNNNPNYKESFFTGDGHIVMAFNENGEISISQGY